MGKIKNEINKNLLVCQKINEYQFKLMSLKNILSKDLVEHNLKDIPQTTKKKTVNEDLELYDEAQKKEEVLVRYMRINHLNSKHH